MRIKKAEVPNTHGPLWYDRLLEFLLLVGAGYFIWWTMEVFIETGKEPYGIIALVTAIVASAESVIYLSRKNTNEISRQIIRYEYEEDRMKIASSSNQDDGVYRR